MVLGLDVLAQEERRAHAVGWPGWPLRWGAGANGGPRRAGIFDGEFRIPARRDLR